jgi:peptidoglycan hydrolase-like protein with peptidoglycan-binding domain
MVQEKLIDLGLLSGPATGDNDKSTQQAIKSFQKKAGLEKIDGMVGPETLPKLLLGEAAYTTTAPLTSNSNGPVWGDDQLQFMRVNGTIYGCVVGSRNS